MVGNIGSITKQKQHSRNTKTRMFEKNACISNWLIDAYLPTAESSSILPFAHSLSKLALFHHHFLSESPYFLSSSASFPSWVHKLLLSLSPLLLLLPLRFCLPLVKMQPNWGRRRRRGPNWAQAAAPENSRLIWNIFHPGRLQKNVPRV